MHTPPPPLRHTSALPIPASAVGSEAQVTRDVGEGENAYICPQMLRMLSWCLHLLDGWSLPGTILPSVPRHDIRWRRPVDRPLHHGIAFLPQLLPHEHRFRPSWQGDDPATSPPAADGFGDLQIPGTYAINSKTLGDTELCCRASISVSISDSMVGTVLAQLSPQDERSRLPVEQLTIVQGAQFEAMDAAFGAAANQRLM